MLDPRVQKLRDDYFADKVCFVCGKSACRFLRDRFVCEAHMGGKHKVVEEVEIHVARCYLNRRDGK